MVSPSSRNPLNQWLLATMRSLLLLLPGVLVALSTPVYAQAGKEVEPVERADVRGFHTNGTKLKSSSLRLTFVQHEGETLPDGRRREKGRVRWTRQACGGACYVGEGAEVPLTFAAADPEAGRLVLGPTVWTHPDGTFDVILSSTQSLTGSATAPEEYALVMRTERARDLPEPARRLLEAATDSP